MLPPDINEAGKEFLATPQGIRFAMTGIKGVGAGVVEAIIKERTKKVPLQSYMIFSSGSIQEKWARKLLKP